MRTQYNIIKSLRQFVGSLNGNFDFIFFYTYAYIHVLARAGQTIVTCVIMLL